jgi:regulatory protein
MARTPSDPLSVTEAHGAGLAMLSRRELSTAQVRQRLARRGFDASAIDGAIARLTESGALDDRRAARAVARTHTHVKRHGADRVRRELGALGIDRDIADEAVSEVFVSVDEEMLLQHALDKRLRRGQDLRDPAVERKLFAALMRQGFSAGAVRRALRSRRSDPE